MRNLLFISILFLQSCSSVAKKMYGIKDPAIESKESIYKYATKINLDTGIIYTVDTTAYLETFLRIQSSVPEAELFSKEGNNISYKNHNQDCNAGLFSFIPDLKKDSTYKQKDNYKLDKNISRLRDLSGLKLNENIKDNSDYYLFIYWVKWLGKLNVDHVNEWVKLAKANKNATIKVIAVNLDFQEWWSDKFKDNIIKRMSKK